MEKKRFSYRKCMAELDQILPPERTELPEIHEKECSLREANEQLRKYKLPILYRYMPISINVLSSIVNEDVYLSSAQSLNDVFEGIPYGIFSDDEVDRRERQRLQKEIYVKSFSYAKNHDLMWGHYGDSHKGICIGYDFSLAPDEVIHHLYPVQYSDARFSTNWLPEVAAHSFLYLRKSKYWEYEKEFRLLYGKDELPHGKQNIPLNCITEIQFGLRMPDDQKKLIADLLRTKSRLNRGKIKLFKTELKNNRFELERIEWEP